MKQQINQQQIEQLIAQGCRAQNWENIYIDDSSDIANIHHVTFDGYVEIGNNACIEHVGTIANYTIGDNVRICRVNELVADKRIEEELQKEGLAVGNEAGDPNIRFTPYPNEKVDWLNMHYPHHSLPKQGNKETEGYSPLCSIGENCQIKNCGTMRNVTMHKSARVEGSAHLENGILHEESYMGTQVIARTFNIGQRTQVTDGAKLYHVIATNDCKIGKGFMAENSYFSHHSELFCGEACAIFAGPHTVSHHKSTLLIGGEFSFYNAGSNTNQSNHAYKLGPIHHGTLARGSKTASGSHILWPMQTAPFTMIMGKVKTHPDLSSLPFSYVIADSDKVYVAPGMNLGTVGTFRDVLKWKQRGQSPFKGEYSFLSPWVIQSVLKGIDTLNRLQQKHGPDADVYPYNDTLIRHSALERGLSRYNLVMRLYAGIITPCTEIQEEASKWHWVDVAGQPAVEELLPELSLSLKESADNDTHIEQINQHYENLSQQWGAVILANLYGKAYTSGQMKEKAPEALEEWKSLLIADAYKELALGDVDKQLVEEFIQKIQHVQMGFF